jgi:putative flippase GtrA
MTALTNLTAWLRRGGRTLLKELSAFGVVGAVCFAVDLGLFQLLYAGAGVGPVVSKLISTLVSMTVAYLGHRHWSFSHRARTGLWREYGVFFAVNAVTMALGLVAVAFVHYVLGQDDALVLQAVNVGSIAVGTLIRFVAYRQWVFVAEEAPAAVAHRENVARRSAAAGQRLAV